MGNSNSIYRHDWYEELPDACPPIDSQNCNGIFYRIANGNPASDKDFFSQRCLQPNKVFEGIDECIVRSLSVFDCIEETERRLKLPKFRNAHIVEVNLSPDDGKIKKTFGNAHFSWWRTKFFNPLKAKMIK